MNNDTGKLSFPVTEKTYKTALYLPSSLSLTGNEIKIISKLILEAEVG
jgi:hypothetical protein